MISRFRRFIGTAMLVVAVTAGMVGGAKARQSTEGVASVAITSPVGTTAHPQEADSSGSFTITVAVSNFTFDAHHIGMKPNRPGFGHYHVYADNFDPRYIFKSYVEAAAAPTVQLSYTALSRAGIRPGIHTIFVVLANNDHSLVEPLAIASTVIRVVNPTPPVGLSITGSVGTASNPLLPGGDGNFTFTVAPQNFTFDPAHIGTRPNKPGSGHYHVYADDIDPRFTFKYYIDAAATTTVRVSLFALAKGGITSGTHTLFVALANNDHSLLQPLVVSSTVIRIAPTLQVPELGNPQKPIVLPAGGKITLHVNATGFRLDPQNIGAKANVQGTGHYQVYVSAFDPTKPQQNAVAIGAGPTVDVTASAVAKLGMHSGLHAIYVVLVNNDNSLVIPFTCVSGTLQVGG